MNVEDKLEFYRELNNHNGDKAISIRNSDGVKIGFVTQEGNVIQARLMDAGKLLFEKITAIDVRETGAHPAVMLTDVVACSWTAIPSSAIDASG